MAAAPGSSTRQRARLRRVPSCYALAGRIGPAPEVRGVRYASAACPGLGLRTFDTRPASRILRSASGQDGRAAPS